MLKVVFLDRDGVINSNANHYYVFRASDFELNEGVVHSLKQMQKNGYSLIIISNQGGVSKQKYTKKDVEELNNYIIALFGKLGIKIMESYYCPHHPDIEQCICRKPNSQMLEKAIAHFNIDTENAIMIGDSSRDIEAARKIGIKGIKVKANANLFDEISNSKYSFIVK